MRRQKHLIVVLLFFFLSGFGEDPDSNPSGVQKKGVKIFFQGSKFDPDICIMHEGKKKCCGNRNGNLCKSIYYLHPSMVPLARCIVKELNVGCDVDKYPDCIAETFRTLETQKSFKSVPAGYSLHNYGLAFDVCCYFKSRDCSVTNLVNKVVGIKVWRKAGMIRCQSKWRFIKGADSTKAVKIAIGSKDFESVLLKVRKCYESSGIKFGRWNWGIGWEDYFDAPHFQYFPSPVAGFYSSSRKKSPAYFLMKLLKDCYNGNRKKFLEELYSFSSPVDFVASKKDGCGFDAYEIYRKQMSEAGLL